LAFLNAPITFNEGVFANIALGMQHGNQPYVDIQDNKPPAIYYLNYLIFQTLGTNPTYLRLVAFVFDILLIFAVFLFAKAEFGAKKALVISSLFAAVFVFTGFGPETPMALLSTISAMLYLRGKQNSKFGSIFAAGIAIAAATYFKQLAALMLIIFVAYEIYLVLGKNQHFKVALKSALILLAGFSVLAIPLLIYFYNLYGTTFLHNVITLNFSYGANSSFVERIGKIWLLLATQLWLVLILVIYNFVSQKYDAKYSFYALWAGIPLILFHFWGEFGNIGYLVQIAPALFILAIGPLKIEKSDKLIRILIIVFLVASSLVLFKAAYDNHRFGGYNDQKDVAAVISANLGPGDKVICDNPTYCYLAGELSAYHTALSPAYKLWTSDFADFGKYANNAKLLVLTHRQYYIGSDIVDCIRQNWNLTYTNSRVDEYFLEIWKNPGNITC
jgi:4-amino-4-deoxy-L-arabinose transferase-like glycosyltransferase